MKTVQNLFIALVMLLAMSCQPKEPVRILVFSKTAGFRHQSIEAGKLALIKLGQEHGVSVDTTEDASVFREENLKQYRAVIFLSTTGDILNTFQEGEFKRFIQAGGGYVGIHAASDTEYEWPWYGKLVGAYFKNHPRPQLARLIKRGTLGDDDLPETWERTDEWYNYDYTYNDIQNNLHVLYTLDETSYEGGENGKYHAVAWYHEYDGGHAFYTGMGHTDESYQEPFFLKQLWQGIEYAIGDESLHYEHATAVHVAEDNRFNKVVLGFEFDEPTEMTILPDGRIIFIERKGDVKLYDPKSDPAIRVINTFEVFTGNEDGMIGLTKDPGFEQNHWLYIYRSHPTQVANVLSRFTFTNDAIDMASEKELLAVPTQRAECCHTGGSLAFGPEGNLFISTGDNTNPFASAGFSPSDERPGRKAWDAQRTAGNTNDLRGKILRIHPEADGTYTIPDGNLFAKDDPKARPEIYVMGCRNPYRIAIDQKTGYLYWGEVGPDANNDNVNRGPRGYDEVNQAKAPGYFGWPYFVGNNYAYVHFDFANDKPGETWDPAHPENHSPNNTGKVQLPPAQPAYIWYPYADSPDFPMVKKGGRNAMAGPVYYHENYASAANPFPDYFDGKLMIYDWMRNWIMLVTMQADGSIKDITPFLQDVRFNNIIDMDYGPDGKLYTLEYGTVWFARNLDARLSRIDYNSGNRPPHVKLQADRTTGSLPLTVHFSADSTVDYDGDSLTYALALNDQTYTSADGHFAITLDKPGVYFPSLTVSDGQAKSVASVRIIAGNQPPVVTASVTEGNQMFFFPGVPVHYQVTAEDHEDGSTTNGTIASKAVRVTCQYVEGYDVTQVAQGHQHAPIVLPGKALMAGSDCQSCHLIDKASAGPSYQEIAIRYPASDKNVEALGYKIIRGGGGVWGDREMAAHPQLSLDEAKKMVEYILSLNPETEAQKRTLPLAGTFLPQTYQTGAYVLKASYTDQPVNDLPTLTDEKTVALRAPWLTAQQAEALHGAERKDGMKQHYVGKIGHDSWIMFKNIDFTQVRALLPTLFALPVDLGEATVEFRLDSPDGKRIAALDFAKARKKNTQPPLPAVTIEKISIESVESIHDLYVVFKNDQAADKTLCNFSQVELCTR